MADLFDLVVSLAGIILVAVIFLSVTGVILYFILKKGNVKVKIFEVNSEGIITTMKEYNGFLNEQKKELTIFNKLFGGDKVEDFPSSEKYGNLVILLKYNGEYMPARPEVSSFKTVRVHPLFDPARARVLAERIVRNKSLTTNLGTQRWVELFAIGIIVLLLIANLVITNQALGSFTENVKEFRQSIEALNSKIVVQPQPITQQPQEVDENKPKG